MQTTDTTTTLTRQQIAAMLKKAGFTASFEGRNGRIGYATRSFGYSVTENGERVYTCKSCGGRTFHRDSCRTRSGAAKYWRSRIVKDGTVTVTIHGRTTTLKSDLDDAKAMAEKVVEFLTAAGFKVEKRDGMLTEYAYIVSA